jgi:hypothetical protein
MTTNQLNKVVAFAGPHPESNVVVGKAIQLSVLLKLPIELRAFLSMRSTNGHSTVNEVNQWLEEFKTEEALLKSHLKQAQKKKIEGTASVVPVYEPTAELGREESVLVMDFNDRWKWMENQPRSLSYLHFKDSRKTVKLDQVVIFAETDLGPTQEEQFIRLASLLSESGGTIRVVLIEGQSNLVAWQKFMGSSKLKNSTADILGNVADLPRYLKKHKVYLLCIPNFEGNSAERIMSLHQMNKTDIILF